MHVHCISKQAWGSNELTGWLNCIEWNVSMYTVFYVHCKCMTYVHTCGSSRTCVLIVYVYVLIISIVWRGTCWSNINHRSFKIQLRMVHNFISKHNKTQHNRSTPGHYTQFSLDHTSTSSRPLSHNSQLFRNVRCLPRWAHSTTPGKSLEISSATTSHL